MSGAPVCPCDVFVFPRTVSNPPGLDVIRYRIGDFSRFREALLRPLPGEIELRNWRPTAQGDLALQMLEWWAYLADVLTFYNERIANESYLRTAVLPESVQRLIRILGYRPRPGIGATGVVAALLSVPGPILVPQGFPIQSKPGPGKDPQIFETDSDSRVSRPDALPADATADTGMGESVLLKGTVSGINVGDELLLLKRGWAGETNGNALVIVLTVATEKDPRGRANTRITFGSDPGFTTTEKVTDYRLLRSTQVMGLWPMHTNAAGATTPKPELIITPNSASTISVNRQMEPRTPLLIDVNGKKQLVTITTYSEVVWFANSEDPDHPENGPNPAQKIGIPIPHSVVGFMPALTIVVGKDEIPGTILRFAFHDVGDLIASPAAALDQKTTQLNAPEGTSFHSGLKDQPVLLEDVNHNGASAKVSSSSPAALKLSALSLMAAPLKPPLQVLLNLLNVSRGKTVASETLGSGDASVAGQEFVLQKSPLTYLQTSDPAYPDGYRSTLRVWVNGVEWTEAPSFYGQKPNARIFVTQEDQDNQTRVKFGDGVNGARLPSGSNNVVARYRYGSGADVPDAGKLTVITQPLPGLKTIENPVPPGRGADPDSPQRIRQLAPRTILTFGRAVSGDDYEVMAAQTPGVDRARAYWSFDPTLQRTVVTLYVGDTPAAVDAATKSLARSADPNRPVSVKPAKAVSIGLSFTLVVDAAYQNPAAVKDAVETTLIDPDSGLFGARRMRIGAKLFRSQIEDACLRVPGSVAVHSFLFTVKKTPDGPLVPSDLPYSPAEGGFVELAKKDLTIDTEVAAHAR
ncbi:MAG TPA: hypothetical protein VHA33_07625 [Candidatus Angelobacter sp.]|jgi:hypothetical protein|nr:hypothetical protein [Candidatus Angelobacter sp.]